MKTDEQIAGQCCWCEGELSAKIQGIGSSYSESISPEETFQAVPLPKSERTIYGAIIKKGSRALTEGFHLMFATCSEACTQELNQALAKENGRFLRQTPMIAEA